MGEQPGVLFSVLVLPARHRAKTPSQTTLGSNSCCGDVQGPPAQTVSSMRTGDISWSVHQYKTGPEQGQHLQQSPCYRQLQPSKRVASERPDAEQVSHTDQQWDSKKPQPNEFVQMLTRSGQLNILKRPADGGPDAEQAVPQPATPAVSTWYTV